MRSIRSSLCVSRCGAGPLRSWAISSRRRAWSLERVQPARAPGDPPRGLRGESRFRRLSRRSRFLRLVFGGLGRVRPPVLAAEGRRDFRLPGAGQPRILAFAPARARELLRALPAPARATLVRRHLRETGPRISRLEPALAAARDMARAARVVPAAARTVGRGRCDFGHARAPASSAVHQQPRHVRHDPRAARLRAAVHAVGEDARHGFGPRPQLRALRARRQDLPGRGRRGRAPRGLAGRRPPAARRRSLRGRPDPRVPLPALSARGRTLSRSKSAASRRTGPASTRWSVSSFGGTARPRRSRRRRLDELPRPRRSLASRRRGPGRDPAAGNSARGRAPAVPGDRPSRRREARGREHPGVVSPGAGARRRHGRNRLVRDRRRAFRAVARRRSGRRRGSRAAARRGASRLSAAGPRSGIALEATGLRAARGRAGAALRL